jgi:hypothetical protein
MSGIQAFLNSPVPIWFFGGLMYTCLWFLNHQNQNFRGSWRPASGIIAWSLIIGMGVGIALTGVFFWKFGLGPTAKGLAYASILAAVLSLGLQRITTHFTMVVVSFFAWPYFAYVIASSLFRW